MSVSHMWVSADEASQNRPRITYLLIIKDGRYDVIRNNKTLLKMKL